MFDRDFGRGEDPLFELLLQEYAYEFLHPRKIQGHRLLCIDSELSDDPDMRGWSRGECAALSHFVTKRSTQDTVQLFNLGGICITKACRPIVAIKELQEADPQLLLAKHHECHWEACREDMVAQWRLFEPIRANDDLKPEERTNIGNVEPLEKKIDPSVVASQMVLSTPTESSQARAWPSSVTNQTRGEVGSLAKTESDIQSGNEHVISQTAVAESNAPSTSLLSRRGGGSSDSRHVIDYCSRSRVGKSLIWAPSNGQVGRQGSIRSLLQKPICRIVSDRKY